MESGSCSAPYSISDVVYKAVRPETAAELDKKEEARLQKTVSHLVCDVKFAERYIFGSLCQRNTTRLCSVYTWKSTIFVCHIED